MKELRMRCGSELHRVIVGRGGALAFPDHRDGEVKLEMAMASLAGEPPMGCAWLLWAVRHLGKASSRGGIEAETRDFLAEALAKRMRRTSARLRSRLELERAEVKWRGRVAVRLIERVLSSRLGLEVHARPSADGRGLEVSFSDVMMNVSSAGFLRAWREAGCRTEDGRLLLEITASRRSGIVLEGWVLYGVGLEHSGHKRFRSVDAIWRVELRRYARIPD